MIPVVLSGGSGTRLWPVSRARMPKQFAEIFDESLMAKTLKRVAPFGAPWIVTVESMSTLTEKVCQDMGIPLNQIIYEPMGRNTAPAIALLCKLLQIRGMGREVVGIFPADHLIQKENAFGKALKSAELKALEGELVTLGVKPTYPATGYGYIEIEDVPEGSASSQNTFQIRKTRAFKEKPTAEQAEEFVRSGRFYWNAGIFVFQVNLMSEYFERHCPRIWSLLLELRSDLSNLQEIYPRMESISIDYAIAEKITKQVCVTVDLGWSDVGSWEEISKVRRSSLDKTIEIDSSDNFVFSSDSDLRTYALVGVNDLIVVDTQDCLLIAKKGDSQKVKQVVDCLEKSGRKESREHLFELRPWGRFDVIKDTELFKSKIITVEPGHQLSYQSHEKRAEHWIFLKGSAEVILDDKTIKPKTGQAVYIPVGTKHRVRNIGNEKVLFVEVQVGSYFGEDDIVRYQDDYRRV